MKNIILFTIFTLTSLFAQVNNLLQTSNSKNYFIENKGQWPEEVKYLAKIGGMNAWITKTGVVYDYYKIEHNYTEDEMIEMPEHEKDEFRSKNTSVYGHVVKSLFNNVNTAQRFNGENEQETYYNYFIGNDKSKWASNVKLYEGATIEELYNGIDIKYYCDDGFLRYDFIAKPGADINQIAMSFEGADSYKVNDNGELEIETSLGIITHKDIFAYQETVKGDRQIVQTTFNRKENGAVGFSAENYDREKELIIDPLVYSTLIGVYGSSYNDIGTDIAIDNIGNAYFTGRTNDGSYPTIIGSYDETTNGLSDIIITKLNATGTGLIFSTFLGGSSIEVGTDIKIDDLGNVIVYGETKSIDFPITVDAYDTEHNSYMDLFICKLSNLGNSLLYSTFFGGNDDDNSNGGIDIDSLGYLYLVGTTTSLDFPITIGSYPTITQRSIMVFASKFDLRNNNLVYSTIIGIGKAQDMKVDKNGNTHITGYTYDKNFPTTDKAFDKSFNVVYPKTDAFISKLNFTGDTLLYSTFIGGTNENKGIALDLDVSGDIYVAGYTTSHDFPTTDGAINNVPQFNTIKNFLVRLNPFKNKLVYSASIFGLHLTDLVVDFSKNALITGYTNYPEYPVTKQAFDKYIDNTDVVLSKVNSSGTEFIYSSFLGGGGDDISSALTIDHYGNAYIIGKSGSINFPQNDDYSNSGYYGIFVSKLNTYTPLLITSPKALDNLQLLSTHNIEWESEDVEQIKIEYSIDNGIEWLTIVESITSSIGSYPWILPNKPSDECIIRITDISNSLISDSSEVFSILLKDVHARLLADSVLVQQPCYVNLLFHAVDENNKGIKNLDLYVFEARENGNLISLFESRLQVGGIDHVRLATFKTVLLLDNSTSVQPNLQQIKDAAIALIENKLPEQEIALYVFSENPILLQDFTTNTSTLVNSVNSISVGFATTNLYGSIITALNRWEDAYSFDIAKQGFLVALTDGDDTQGSSSLEQVLATRGNKRIYTIGLGTDINANILSQIGNAKSFIVPNIEDLTQHFIEIQQDLTAYTNSFYRLNYVSPKRGNNNHTLRISVKGNLNTESDSFIETSFNSDGFYSVLFGITVESTVENPFGVDSLSISPNGSLIVKIETPFTFGHEGYIFTPSDLSKLKIESVPGSDIEHKFIASGSSGDEVNLQIEDPTNGYSKTIKIIYDLPVGIDDDKTIPKEYVLEQNYPNPFNPTTTISYSIPVVDAKFASTANVMLKVYDILGTEVKTLVNKKQNPGRYKVEFDASSLSSGVYFYRITSGKYSNIKKLLLLK